MTELQVKWMHDRQLRGEQLVALHRLAQLRKLCLRMPCVAVEGYGLDDGVFAKLISGGGKLLVLS